MNTATIDSSCTVCNNSSLNTVINFGMQPPSNRFVSADNCKHEQELYPLGFGYCAACGTSQLTQRMPFDSFRPRFNWLLYNEPEGHLDDAAKELTTLPGIDKNANILGITYKDQSTIDRLAKLGIPSGKCVNEKDFNSPHNLFGLETIQGLLRNSEIINHLKNKYGRADILLMRHIIEHSDNAAELIFSLKELVNEDGYLVMELPDSEKVFQANNHAFIWEEHISYFTEKSLATLAKHVGAEIAWFKRCSYPYEDSLMVAFRFDKSNNSNVEVSMQKADEGLQSFSESFLATQQHWREQLTGYLNKGEKVAVFGAGHLAAKFINFFNLKDLIDCVIDDNANKAGMQMPGSLLPIVPSSAIAERGIRHCISTLSPESEIKVKQKLSCYFDNGVSLIPAFSVVRKK